MNAVLLAGLAVLLATQGASLYWIIALVIAAFAFMIGQLIMKQESMLYVPCPVPGMQRCSDNPEGYRTPKDRSLRYENVHFTTEDGLKLHAWFMPALEEKPLGTLLFCHANAGNIGMRLPNFEQLLKRMPINIFAFDYRGYGESEGEPNETGLFLDVKAAWQWLERRAAAEGVDDPGARVDPERIFVFGRSLGGAVAIALADFLEKRGDQSEASPKACGLQGVILENTFTSIYDLVDDLFPFLAWPMLKQKFLRLHWPSKDRIKDLEVPLLFLSGQQDEIVPARNMRLLYDAAVSSKSRVLSLFPTGTHNDTWEKGGAEYWIALREFVEKWAPPR